MSNRAAAEFDFEPAAESESEFATAFESELCSLGVEFVRDLNFESAAESDFATDFASATHSTCSRQDEQASTACADEFPAELARSIETACACCRVELALNFDSADRFRQLTRLPAELILSRLAEDFRAESAEEHSLKVANFV